MTIMLSEYIQYLQDQLAVQGDLPVARLRDGETASILDNLPSNPRITEWKTDPYYPNDAYKLSTLRGRNNHSCDGARFIPHKQNQIESSPTIRLFEL